MWRYFNVNLSQNLQTAMPDTEQNKVAVATELVYHREQKPKSKTIFTRGTTDWQQEKHGKNGWRKWRENSAFLQITEPLDKKDPLLIYGRKEIAQLNKSHRNPTGEFLYQVQHEARDGTCCSET